MISLIEIVALLGFKNSSNFIMSSVLKDHTDGPTFASPDKVNTSFKKDLIYIRCCIMSCVFSA